MTSDLVEMTCHKHMLSPSRLLKIIGVLARNGGGNKWTVIVIIGSMSLLNMALFSFTSGWGHLISLHFFLHGFGLSYLAARLLVVLPFRPLIIWPPNTAKSVVVPPICSREVDLCEYNLPLIFHAKQTCLYPSRVDDVGIIMAHLR